MKAETAQQRAAQGRGFLPAIIGTAVGALLLGALPVIGVLSTAAVGADSDDPHGGAYLLVLVLAAAFLILGPAGASIGCGVALRLRRYDRVLLTAAFAAVLAPPGDLRPGGGCELRARLGRVLPRRGDRSRPCRPLRQGPGPDRQLSLGCLL